MAIMLCLKYNLGPRTEDFWVKFHLSSILHHVMIQCKNGFNRPLCCTFQSKSVDMTVY